MGYYLQIQQSDGWLTLGFYPDGLLDAAIESSKRTVLSQKSSSRVIESVGEEVVYEMFYNRADDPDENWRDEDEYELEEHELSWKEAGF